MLFSTAELNGESLNPITAIHIFPMTSTLISSNLSSSFFPTQNIHRIRIPTTSIPGSFNIRARRSKIVAKSLDLPLLPFSMSEVITMNLTLTFLSWFLIWEILTQVLVPTESKTLHLYEARYLALLEEVWIRYILLREIDYMLVVKMLVLWFWFWFQSMKRKKNMFVHFILDPISISETATEASFAARYGCLVLIENVSLFRSFVLLFVEWVRYCVSSEAYYML